jgi:two-component system LytT family response regulator
MTNPTNLTAIIVDDAPAARELLRLMLAELAPNVAIKGEAENVAQAVALIKSAKPDLIFLDIEMPAKSGLQLVTEIAQTEFNYQIIFTTAYNQYAIQAFRLSAIDYLLKPIKEQQLVEAVEKAAQQKQLAQSAQLLANLQHNLSIQNGNILAIPLQYNCEYLPVNDIECIEAEGAYVHIFLKNNKKIFLAKTLKYFEQALSHLAFFVKIHRSYIINLHYMRSFCKSERGIITLLSGKEVELSRSHRKDFIAIIDNLKPKT